MAAPLMEKLPGPGWSRLATPVLNPKVTSESWWIDGRVVVGSSLANMDAPDGSGEVIPQWLMSVTEHGKRPSPRRLRAALRALGMLDAEEDNHHPGNARHFFKPVDPKRRVACECKTGETVVQEADGYTWTQPVDGPCRGCELERAIGKRCPIHAERSAP